MGNVSRKNNLTIRIRGESLLLVFNLKLTVEQNQWHPRLKCLVAKRIHNILDFRLVLEGGYLRQSIGHITEENLAELAEIDERCKQSTDSVWDHWEANTAFHLKMISFSGNAYAYQELERTMNVLKRAYAQFYWQTWSNINPALDIAHHNDIMQSIREKDLEKTQNYLKEDLADFCG